MSALLAAEPALAIGQVLEATANALTLLVAVGTALLALIRRFDRTQRRVLGRPLRRARKKVLRSLPGGDGARNASLGALLQRLEKVQIDALLEEERLAPGALIAKALAGDRSADAVDGRPGWVVRSRAIRDYLDEARSLKGSSLLSRILYPEETRDLRRALGETKEHVERFDRCEPVGERAEGSTALSFGSFAAFVAGLSGAVVLVDAAASRSRHAESVLLWHSRRYRSHEHPADDGRGDYATEHGAGGCSAWETADRPPGDFDQRVIDLRSATLAEATTEGYLAMVLETAETCYATTELGATIGCKHVEPTWARDPAAPVVRRLGRAPSGVALGDGQGRVVLLTSYVAVISADGQLLLARRTGQVRHGQGTLSATAGGVLEPGAAGAGGDTDDCGMPDPLTCVLRETREEIGLELRPEACRPVSVFLANIRGRTAETRNDGQLVGVVLYLATIEGTADEARQAAASGADPARGAFEQDGLACVPLTSPGDVAAWAHDHASQLDQHGLLSCLYASTARFGHAETRTAFSRAFEEAPWWALSPYADGADRLVRDPRHLIEDPDVLSAPADVRWRDNWIVASPSTAAPRTPR